MKRNNTAAENAVRAPREDKTHRAIALVMRAAEAVEVADNAMYEALMEAFPAGTQVIYRYQHDGRTREIRGTVEYPCAGRFYGGQIVITNNATQKTRRINPAFCLSRGELEVLNG